MKSDSSLRPLLVLACTATVILAGCANAPSAMAPKEAEKPAVAAPAAPAPVPAPPPAELVKAAAQRDLAEGIQLYDKGDFNAAISKLGNSPEIAAADPEIQVAAIKYLAFSFCVTNRQAQCRAQFEAAFKLDPAFDLSPAERGHPLWGPAFDRVKRAQARAKK